MSARESAAICKQLELTGFEANKRGQQFLLELVLHRSGNVAYPIGSVFGYRECLDLTIMLPETSSFGEKFFSILPSLRSYNSHILRFMQTLDYLDLKTANGLQKFNKDEALVFFEKVHSGLTEWSEKLDAPKSLNKFQEPGRNKQLLPFYLAGMTPSMASYALHRKLPAFHPVVLAVHNRTLSPVDVDRKQLLIIPPMKLPQRIKANSATMEAFKGMVPAEVLPEDIH